MRRLRCSWFALALTSVLGGCSDKTPEGHFERAEALWQKNDGRGALIELKSAVQAFPDSAEARMQLGLAQLKLDQPSAAIKEFEAALALGADVQQGRTLIAEARNLQGDFKQVLDTLAVDDRLPPEQRARVQQLRADALSGLGNTEAACSLYTLAARDHPGLAPAVLGQARCSAIQGDFENALKRAQTATQLVPQSADPWLLIATIENARKRRDAAITAFDQALEREPRELAALAGKIRTQAILDQLDAARATLRQLRSFHPRHLAGDALEGMLALQENDPAAAKTALQRALKSAPESPEILLLMASAQQALGENASAVSTLNKVVRLTPDTGLGRSQLAALHLAEGRPEAALDVLAPLLDKRASPQQLALASEALQRLGREQEIRPLLERAVAAAPGSSAAALPLSVAALREGKPDAALDLLDKVTDDPAIGGKASLARARILLSQGKKDDAVDLLTRTLKSNQDSVEIYVMRGAVLATQKKFRAARADFQAAEQLATTNPIIQLSLAELDRAEGKPAAASERLRKALVTSPKNETLLLASALDAQRNRRTEDARALIERTLKVNPDSLPARQLQIRAALDSKDNATALSLARALAQSRPDHGAAQLLYAVTLLANGDKANATEQLQALYRKSPGAPAIGIPLARVLLADGKIDEARKVSQAVLERAPGNADALRTLAALELAHGSPANARKYADLLAAVQPDSSTPELVRAELILRSKNPKTAELLQALGQFRVANTKLPTARTSIRIAALLDQLGRRSDADTEIAIALKRAPESLVLRRVHADRLVSLGRKSEATKHYEFLAQRSPDNVVILNNLASLLVEVDPKRALPLVSKARQLAPQSGEIADTQGQVLMKLGQDQETLAAFKFAHARLPEHPGVKFRLAQALARTGDTVSARQTLDSVLALSAVFPERRQAEALRTSLR